MSITLTRYDELMLTRHGYRPMFHEGVPTKRVWGKPFAGTLLAFDTFTEEFKQVFKAGEGAKDPTRIFVWCYYTWTEFCADSRTREFNPSTLEQWMIDFERYKARNNVGSVGDFSFLTQTEYAEAIVTE